LVELGKLDGFLRRFLATGTGNIINATWTLFGVHKSGVDFPMVLAVRESPPTQAPSFIGMCRAIRTRDHYVLLNDEWFVTAISAGSIDLLGTEVHTLRDTSGRPTLHIKIGRASCRERV